MTVRITAYTHNPIVKTSLFGSAVTAEEVIKNVRNYASRMSSKEQRAMLRFNKAQ